MYTSDDRGILFSKSLERHLFDGHRKSDFTNITSLRGVYLTNKLDHGTVWPNPPLLFSLTCCLPDFVQPNSTFTYIPIALTYHYLCCRQPNKIRHFFQQRRNVGATRQARERGL